MTPEPLPLNPDNLRDAAQDMYDALVALTTIEDRYSQDYEEAMGHAVGAISRARGGEW